MSDRIDPTCQVLETVRFLSLEDVESWKEAMVSVQPTVSSERVSAKGIVQELFDVKIGREKLEAFYRQLDR